MQFVDCVLPDLASAGDTLTWRPSVTPLAVSNQTTAAKAAQSPLGNEKRAHHEAFSNSKGSSPPGLNIFYLKEIFQSKECRIGERDERREQCHRNVVVCMIIAECDSADEATYLQHRVQAMQHREMIPKQTKHTHRANICAYRRRTYLTNDIRHLVTQQHSNAAQRGTTRQMAYNKTKQKNNTTPVSSHYIYHGTSHRIPVTRTQHNTT